MLKLYGVPGCKKIKDTKNLLDANQIEYEFINVTKNPVEREYLQHIAINTGMDNIYNFKGPTFRKLKLDYYKMTEEEKIEKLFKNQNMINRPLLEKNDQFMAGFDESKILKFAK